MTLQTSNKPIDTTIEQQEIYKNLGYYSLPFPYTTPAFLEAYGTLLGLTPPPAETARVLELGSSFGGNIISQALHNPNATFTGIELSKDQVEKGQAVIDECEIDNITLYCKNIMDITDDIGEFDYIICHGVYSWVPEHVRNNMIKICETHLAPNGLVYISYNTYPGWHSIEEVRQLMLFANKQQSKRSHLDKVKRGKYIGSLIGRQILNYDNLQQKNAKFLSDLRQTLMKDDYVIGHDHLEPNNDPLYFHQFIDHIESNGLTYVCDADLTLSMVKYYDSQLGQKLDAMSDGNQTDMEQYLDFIVDTPFRKSILCKSEFKNKVDYTLSDSESYKIKKVQDLLDLFIYTIQLPEEVIKELDNPLYKDMLQTISQETKEFSMKDAKATLKILSESNKEYKDKLKINKAKHIIFDELYQFILTHIIRGGFDFKVQSNEPVQYKDGQVYVLTKYINFVQSLLNGKGKGIMLGGDSNNAPIGDLNEEDLQFMAFLEKPRERAELIDFIMENAFSGHNIKDNVFASMAEDYYKELCSRIERFGFLAR